ncbi:MAG: PD-(D/E)XK nuclease family protein, partial [Clostridia bacterium]|nr:PD-(D/E)XK nuclease family protein [Clostridia bacterium]
IPFFSDRTRAFSSHPFCAFVLSALEAASSGGLPDCIDAVASSAYFGKGDNYRNYLLKFGGYRGAYKKEIKEGEAVKDYDREELLVCREKMLGILSLLPAKGKGSAYTAAVRALYTLAGGEEVTARLQEYFTGAEREFLDISPLEGVLFEIEELAGAQTFTAREFLTLLKNGLDALEISMIPQFADAVFVGDVTESKLTRAKVLFCTGLTDALPRASSDTAVITDGDIKKLSELSVTIEPAIAIVNARARESFALNLCAFENALYLSRPLRSGDAETSASEVLSYVNKLFELLPMPELFPYNCSEEVPAFLQLYALKEDFEEGREYDKRRFSALLALMQEKGEGELPASSEKKNVPAAAELYFARDISPTLLESYFACPYSGFMMRGLRLREREERSVLDTDTGTFVHAVLEKTAVKFNEFESEEQCRTYAASLALELLSAPRFALLSDTKAGVYTGERLVRESAEVALAAYRQLVGSSFRVAKTEGTVSIPELSIRGTADRIDEADGYIRVIDYKTGEIDDKAVSYYTGRKLQLQLYLLAASREGKAAGGFYFPARDDFSKPDEEKFRMKGFFSKDERVLSLMDKVRLDGEKSRFFEGGGRTEKGMEGEDFSHFLNYALLVSEKAEREMRAGNITPSPYEGACSYCKCKGMCAFSGTPRKEGKVSPQTVVKIVRRERGEEV